MGFSLEARGGTRAWHTQGRRAALVILAVVLSLAAGCGQRADDKKAGSTQAAKRSQPASRTDQTATSAKPRATAAPAGTRTSATPVASSERSASKASRARNRVLMTQRGCIQLEPHWSNLTIGESIEWTSDLSTPITVHVSPGVFDRTRFVVNPGATVSSGPVRQSGSFTIWTEPASCQGIPRGVHGSGPGMTVHAPSPR